MKQLLPNGKYIVAVSGGVDSVVLLDMLIVNTLSNNRLEFIVAHYDHGIRANSYKDRLFVENLAKSYGVIFEAAEGNLGESASEDTARKARYEFLENVMRWHKADAIVTAHHKDDVLETIIINLLRGTGRKGLSSLVSKDHIRRPLLAYTKKEIIAYAQKNNLEWREDETNVNEVYLRNKIRHKIIPKLSSSQKDKLLNIYNVSANTNQELDAILNELLDAHNAPVLNVRLLTRLSHRAGQELVAHWLRINKVKNFDEKLVERITLDAKRLPHGKRIPVNAQFFIEINNRNLNLVNSSHSNGKFV